MVGLKEGESLTRDAKIALNTDYGRIERPFREKKEKKKRELNTDYG